MKKFLLSFLAITANTAMFSQLCSDLIISEYVEGSNNNKAIELYNPTSNPISLSNYRLVRYNNGTTAIAGEANSQASINLGNNVIASGDAFVLVIDKRDPNQACPGQNCAVALELQALADTFLCPNYDVSYAMYFNGNDAISLQKQNGAGQWSYVDIFGKIGDPAMVTGAAWSDEFPYDGTVGTWWTKDLTLIRKPSVTNGVTVNPNPFFDVTMEYDSIGYENWTNLGIHSCNCAVNVNEIDNTPYSTVYPNPAENGQLFVQAEQDISSIELLNTLGQSIGADVRNISSKLIEISTTSNNSGLYLVRVNFRNKRSAIHRVTIR
jgi:hypothetical protein